MIVVARKSCLVCSVVGADLLRKSVQGPCESEVSHALEDSGLEVAVPVIAVGL